jgi:hypothetical protein
MITSAKILNIDENLWEHFSPVTPISTNMRLIVTISPEITHPSSPFCYLFPPEKIRSCPELSLDVQGTS